MEILKAIKSKFSIDDGERYHEGYTFGDTWNGWACPMFTLEVCMEIANHLHNLYGLTEFGKEILTYDADKDMFVCYEDDGIDEPWEVYGATTIQYNGKAIKVYPIGSYGWVWWDIAWRNK